MSKVIKSVVAISALTFVMVNFQNCAPMDVKDTMGELEVIADPIAQLPVENPKFEEIVLPDDSSSTDQNEISDIVNAVDPIEAPGAVAPSDESSDGVSSPSSNQNEVAPSVDVANDESNEVGEALPPNLENENAPKEVSFASDENSDAKPEMFFHPDDAENLSGGEEYICVLAGRHGDRRLSLAYNEPQSNARLRDEICMSRNACLKIIPRSRYFKVKYAVRTRFCSKQNERLSRLSDAQIAAKIMSFEYYSQR